MSLLEGLKELMTNRNYILLFIVFNLIYGTHSSLGATIASISAVYGYGVTENSIMCFVYLFGGIFNSFFLGILLDKYQSYRKLVIAICILSLATTFIHIFALPSKSIFVESITMTIIGASLLPISSISYAFAVELTFPVPEVITNGMLIATS